MKQYELVNHCSASLTTSFGNGHSTITVKKLFYSNGTSYIQFYQPDLVTVNDYYPFGMLIGEINLKT